MPTNYQFQPLPLSNEEEFEYFILDLFNELHKDFGFQIYGRRGENQDGIDIISYKKGIVIQCKKKELAMTTTSSKSLKSQLKKEFRSDLEVAVNSNKFEFNKFIFATTYPHDTELQNLAGILSKEFDKEVIYFSWGVITHKLNDCEKTKVKYYDKLVLESTRVNDSKFKESVKKKHIIDQCYESLLRFEGLDFINPRIIAGLYPFKSDSNMKGYPLYNRFCLNTNNAELTKLFDLISIRRKDNLFYIKPNARSKAKCENADDKLKYIQSVFNSSLIHCVETTDGKHHKIPKIIHKNCICSACLSEQLKFTELIDQLESKTASLDAVYGLYKLRDFYKAQNTLKKVIKNEYNPIVLALGHYNDYWLSILQSDEKISKYEYYSKIRSVDFDNEPIQEVIIDLEQDSILSSAHIKVDNIVDQIRRIYEGYETKKFTINGPDYATQLTVEAMIVYFHYRNNFIIKDVYTEYHDLFRKALSGWLFSLNTSAKYDAKLESLKVFHIAVSVYYNSGKDLITIFKKTKTKELILDKQASEFLLKIAVNYFGQIDEVNKKYDELVSNSFSLASDHRSLFSSLLVNLSYSNIKGHQTELLKRINTFIQYQDFLFTYDYRYLGLLFQKKGNWFSVEGHEKLLEVHLNFAKMPSEELIRDVISSFNKNYPKTKISNPSLQAKLIEHVGENHYSYETIIYLRNVLSKDYLNNLDEKVLKLLMNKFDSYLYRIVLVGDASEIQKDNDLFLKYVEYVNNHKGATVVIDKNGFEVIQNYEFINFFSGILYSPIRSLDDEIIQEKLTDLSPCQEWLLNPDSFDYTKFKFDWIQLFNDKIILEYLGRFSKLKSIIADELKARPNKQLSENFVRMTLNDYCKSSPIEP